MPTPVKYLLFILSFILVVIFGLVVLVQTQVTSEKLRKHLLPVAEETLQRKIEFGDIEIGLFTGVTIADLIVKQKSSQDDFISVKLLKLNYRLLSLLRGKVEINQVFLEQPQVKITRFADGKFNFNDLTESTNSRTKKQDKSKKHLSVRDLPLQLLVKDVKITDGLIHFTDQYRNERTPYRYRLDQLNLNARKITLDELFPIDLSMILNDSQIDISGHYNIAAQSGDLVIHSDPLNVVQFAPYFRDLIPFKLGSALLATNLEIDIQPQSLTSKGKFDFTQLDLTAIDDSQLQFKNANLAADYSVSYDLDKQILDLSTLLINFNDLHAGVEGQVDLSGSEPLISSNLILDQIDLRKVMQVVPETFIRDYQKYSLAGIVSGRLSLDGAASRGLNILQDATLSLQDVQVSAKNIRAGISGDIIYKDDVITANNLALKYGELEANLNLKAEDLFDSVPRAEFLMTAGTLDLNSLMSDQPQEPLSSPSTPNGHVDTPHETLNEDIGPIFISIEVVGHIDAEKILFKQLQMDQFVADIDLRNNQLSITNAKAAIADGQIDAVAVIDLGTRGLAYQGQMNIVQPNIVTLMSGLLPQSGQSVSGRLFWQNSFSGRGTDPGSLLDQLQLNGEFSLANGVVEGYPLIDSLASFLGYSDLKVLSFSSLAGQYRLTDGLFNILGDLKSSKVELTPKGTVDVLGRMDLKLNARLSPDLISRLGTSHSLKQVITDQQGWGVLPLEIGGTIDSPKIAFDADALQQQTLNKAKEKAAEKLLERIPTTKGDQEPIRQLLDNTLNKLFGQ
jgi:AsmA protein